jgi:hypothetical protein
VRVSTLKVLNSFHPCSSLQVCGRRSPEPDFFLSASRFATPSASRSWRPLQALDLRIKGSRSFKRQICKDMSRVEPRVAWIVDTLYFSWEIIAFPAISLPSSDQGRLRVAEGSRGLLDASNSRNNEIWVWKRLICTSVDTPKCSSHSVYSMTTVSRGAQNLSSHLQLYIFWSMGISDLSNVHVKGSSPMIRFHQETHHFLRILQGASSEPPTQSSRHLENVCSR